MRTVDLIIFYAGLMIGVSYVAGSLVRTWVSRRPPAKGPDWLPAAAEAAITLLAATAAQLVIDAAAPGTSSFRNFSAVGILSEKALTVWDAVALWAGLAALAGAIAPFSSRFRNASNGLAAAIVLIVRFTPGLLPVVAGAWITGIALFKDVRTTLPLVFGSVVFAEWVLSIADLRSPWGVVHGPETTLWLAGMACLLLCRWSHDGAASAASEAANGDDQ